MSRDMLALAVCATCDGSWEKMQVFDLAVFIAETAVGESVKNPRTPNYSRP